MSRMRETVTTVSTTRDHESNLDALLEDLQTTVSRSNSHLNMDGGNMVGYRSVRRTTTTRDGTPDGTTTEYHVEYLNPANSTHQVNEGSYNSGNLTGHSYNKSYKYNTAENSTGSGDYRMKKNISELDSLLDDLNSAQRRNFSETSTVRSSSSHGFQDSGMIDHRDHATSTPHGSRSVERRYREDKTIRGRSASPMRELVFTGSRSRDPSPIQHNTYYEQREQTPTVQQFYRYEKTTSTRTTGPTITDAAPIEPNSQYHPEERPLAIRQRSPSPSHLHSYEHYSMNRDVPPPSHYTERVVTYNRDAEDYPPRNKSYSYSTSSTIRESRGETPKTPPPHRSPSPVSFQQPPLPKTPDPSHRLTYNVSPPHTVSSYKYSSTTNHYDTHSTMPRPFPAVPSPTQNEQQPPKQLDELLASLGDPDPRNNRFTETRVVENRYQTNHHQNHNGLNQTPAPAPVVEKTIEVNRVENEKAKEKGETKNISGPPVYYPPGELFAKKEESMMMRQEGGGMYKSKGKYAYESKSKSKVKESSGKAMVPVCLPVCCAMPCSIM